MAVGGCERYQRTLGRSENRLVGELRPRWPESQGHVSRSDPTTRRASQEIGGEIGNPERRHSIGAADLKGTVNFSRISFEVVLDSSPFTELGTHEHRRAHRPSSVTSHESLHRYSSWKGCRRDASELLPRGGRECH